MMNMSALMITFFLISTGNCLKCFKCTHDPNPIPNPFMNSSAEYCNKNEQGELTDCAVYGGACEDYECWIHYTWWPKGTNFDPGLINLINLSFSFNLVNDS